MSLRTVRVKPNVGTVTRFTVAYPPRVTSKSLSLDQQYISMNEQARERQKR